MTFARLETSQSRLHIYWNRVYRHPVQNPTTPREAIAALFEQAEGKPILINRVSGKLNKKVQKLYDEALASERFKLASQWFYTVQVGDEVLDKKHFLNALFSNRKPAVLVVASADGKRIKRFLGTSEQKVKWTPIASMLSSSYKGSATKAVRGLERLLCTFDVLDARRTNLNDRLAKANAEKDKAKAKSIQAKLDAQEKERDKAYAEEKKLRELALRKPVEVGD